MADSQRLYDNWARKKREFVIFIKALRQNNPPLPYIM